MYTRAESVDASAVGDRLILYNRTSRTAVVLNPTGALVWGFLERPFTQESLIQKLRAAFPELPEDQARQDVAVYLEEMLAQGVIRQGD